MKKILIILLILWLRPILPQYQDSIYTVEIIGSISPVISYYGFPRYSGAPDNATFGYSGTARVMWFPGRLLSVGILSGYTFLVKEEINIRENPGQSVNANAILDAVPLQVVVTMQEYDFEIGMGMGPYLLMSTINYGSTATGKRFELGLTIFGSYVFRLTEGLCVGPEIRVLYLSYRRILSFMPTVSLHFDAFRY